MTAVCGFVAGLFSDLCCDTPVLLYEPAGEGDDAGAGPVASIEHPASSTQSTLVGNSCLQCFSNDNERTKPRLTTAETARVIMH